MKRLTLLLWLFCATAFSQNVTGPTIQVPKEPLTANVPSTAITVLGLTAEQAKTATLKVYPPENTICVGMRPWADNGDLIVLFSAPKAGAYYILLVVKGAEPSGYTVSEGKVNVGGTVDPVNPPMPPVVTGKRLAVVLWETSQLTSQLSKLRLDSRTDQNFQKFLADKGHPQPLFLDKDRANEKALVAKLTKEAKSPLPLLFVLEDSEDGSIVSQGPIPTDVNGLMDSIRKAGG